MSEEEKLPLRIMAVEDEALVRRFIDKCIDRLGHRLVALASTSEECLELAKETDPDLILMDVKISGQIDGIETADTLQKETSIPVIFVTAHADVATVERAAKTKPYGYIVKPFTEKDLRGAITIAMSRVSIDKVNDSISIGHGYEYVMAKRQLLKDNEIISLTKKEQLLLHKLATNQGETVFYKDISEFVWRLDEFKSANALRDLVYRLRKKIPEHKVTSTSGVGIQLERP